MPRPNIFSLVTALVAFSALYVLASWAVPSWKYVDVLLYVGAGFLFGLLSPRDGLLGGAILGVLAALVVFAVMYILGPSEAVTAKVFVTVIIGAILWCSAGAAVGEIVARQR